MCDYISFDFNVRPLNDDEIRSNVPRVISCNEHKREVTVIQNLANKQVDRAFTFDKVGFSSPSFMLYDYFAAMVFTDD